MNCVNDEGSVYELSSSGGEDLPPQRRRNNSDDRPRSKKPALDESLPAGSAQKKVVIDDSLTTSTRVGNDESESCWDCGDSSASGTAHGHAFAACFERLIEVVWAFYLRAQLLNALLRGDALESASWSVRFLGLAEPWGLRRVQELTLHGLELTSEILQGGIGQEAEMSRQSLDGAWHQLREACVAYLGAPIIPRLDARLKRSVSSLSELGLRPSSSFHNPGPDSTIDEPVPSRVCGDTDETIAAKDVVGKLEKKLASLLGPGGHGSPGGIGASPPRQFDEKGRGLRAFRSSDAVHTAFRRAFVEAAAGHPDGKCQLDPRHAVIQGAEVATMLGKEPAWSTEGFGQLREVLSSTPLSLPDAGSDSKEADARIGVSPLPSRGGDMHRYEIQVERLEHASDEGQDDANIDGLNLEEVMLDVRRSESQMSKGGQRHRRHQDSILCCSTDVRSNGRCIGLH